MPQLPMYGWVGLFARLPTVLEPHKPMLFLFKTMTNNITNFGTINFYDNNNSQPKKQQSQQVEDVTPIPLPFLVLDKLTELGTYTLEEFAEKYHKAVKAGAPQLAKFLRRYSELKVFNLDGYNKRDTYDELKSFFGEEMDFGYTNFTLYY